MGGEPVNRSERATLRAAAAIIARELAAGREVRVPGFGKFWRSWVEAPGDMLGEQPAVLAPVARFRGWAGLKKAMGGVRQFCRFNHLPVSTWGRCARVDGHDGECSERRVDG